MKADWYNEQTIKNTINPHKQAKPLQRKNKALVADYRNVNAIAELNFQDMVHILRNYSGIQILSKSMGTGDL